MTTLEKVAKAVCEKLFGPFDVRELDRPSSVSAQSMMATRAALESLKNPTPDMCIAGGIAIAEAMKTAETHVDNAHACWNAMLDAILNEKEG